MPVEHVEWEMNRHIFIHRVLHVDFDSIMHEQAFRAIAGALPSVVRNAVASEPGIQSEQIDEKVYCAFGKDQTSPCQ